jgi:hypothetical protein
MLSSSSYMLLSALAQLFETSLKIIMCKPKTTVFKGTDTSDTLLKWQPFSLSLIHMRSKSHIGLAQKKMGVVKHHNTVTWRLKARIVEQEEMPVARKRHGKLVSMATNTYATTEEPLGAVFSTRLCQGYITRTNDDTEWKWGSEGS